MKNLAAIDIGSNAIRMVIAHLESPKQIKILQKERVPIRLGEEAFGPGVLSQSTIDKMLAAFVEFKSALSQHGMDSCPIVATSALREATNTEVLTTEIRSKTGLQIDVISGEKEAELIHLAVSKEIAMENKNAVSIDVGGGSVEISIVKGNKFAAGRTFPIGAVRIMRQIEKAGLNENHFNMILGEYANEIHHYLTDHLSGESVDFCVGTGGNLECLGRLKVKMLKRSQNTLVSATDLELIVNRLRGVSVQDRVDLLGLRPDRADVIVPALLSVQMIMRQSGCDLLKIPYVGLKDGLIWSQI